MLTTNINITDRLVNGQMGAVVRIDVDKVRQKPTVIYIKIYDKIAGTNLIQRSGSPVAREHGVIPIKLSKIKLRPGKLSSPEVCNVFNSQSLLPMHTQLIKCRA